MLDADALGQVVVGAEPQARHRVELALARREENDRQLRRLLARSSRRQLEAAPLTSVPRLTSMIARSGKRFANAGQRFPCGCRSRRPAAPGAASRPGSCRGWRPRPRRRLRAWAVGITMGPPAGQAPPRPALCIFLIGSAGSRFVQVRLASYRPLQQEEPVGIQNWSEVGHWWSALRLRRRGTARRSTRTRARSRSPIAQRQAVIGAAAGAVRRPHHRR